MRATEFLSDDESDDTTRDTLYRLRDGTAEPPVELGTIEGNAGAFVSAGLLYVVDPDGTVREGSGPHVAARLELPPSPYPTSSRSITAVAAQGGGRLAVAVSDSTRISMGTAPCCSRLLLFADVPLRRGGITP